MSGDLLTGYAAMGEYIGRTDRQAEDMATRGPPEKRLPTFKRGGRRVYALKSAIDAWLKRLAEGEENGEA